MAVRDYDDGNEDSDNSFWYEGDADWWKYGNQDSLIGYSGMNPFPGQYGSSFDVNMEEALRGPDGFLSRLNYEYGNFYKGPQPKDFEGLDKLVDELSYIPGYMRIIVGIATSEPRLAYDMLNVIFHKLELSENSPNCQLVVDKKEMLEYSTHFRQQLGQLYDVVVPYLADQLKRSK
jgi:hypothetical protein